MPTYISLATFTQKGIENIKESPERLDKFKAAVKASGGEVKAFYLTMGRYDIVYIMEAADDEAAATIALALGAAGNARTETLKSFTEDEYRKIIVSIP